MFKIRNAVALFFLSLSVCTASPVSEHRDAFLTYDTDRTLGHQHSSGFKMQNHNLPPADVNSYMTREVPRQRHEELHQSTFRNDRKYSMDGSGSSVDRVDIQKPSSPDLEQNALPPVSIQNHESTEEKTQQRRHQGRENEQDDQLAFAGILSSLARWFGFGREHAIEKKRSDKKGEAEDNQANIEESKEGGVRREARKKMEQVQIAPRSMRKEELERTRQFFEASPSPVAVSKINEEDGISQQDLLNMIRLLHRIFEKVERTLSNEEVQEKPKRPISVDTQHLERVDDGGANELARYDENREGRVQEGLPDVAFALAEAERLNRKRENERQRKVRKLDSDAHEVVDLTSGLPRSAPSYPTRAKLQIAADIERIKSGPRYDEIADVDDTILHRF